MTDLNQVLEIEIIQIVGLETLHTTDIEIILMIGIETVQTIEIQDIKIIDRRLFKQKIKK